MLDSNPKISIITACYNSEETIESCIASVIKQSYKNIEYIVIDGKSADATCDIIQQYKDHVAVYVSEPDSGIYSAWNKGIKYATGDYIFFLNSDDTLFDNHVIEDVVRCIISKGYPDVIHGKVMGFEAESGYSYIDGRATKLDDLIYKMHYCTPAAFVSHYVYEKTGLFDESYKISSDYDWSIRLFKQCDNTKIFFYDRIICKFSVGGCSNLNYKLAYKEVSEIVRRHFALSSYLKHMIYVRSLLTIKAILPFLRKTGLLSQWRKLKYSIKNNMGGL